MMKTFGTIQVKKTGSYIASQVIALIEFIKRSDVDYFFVLSINLHVLRLAYKQFY